MSRARRGGGRTGRQKGRCLSVGDGLRCSRSVPLADALIRANAEGVLQEGKRLN